jgi:glycosyltransferase involved in cell wall biosynthesis
MRVDTNSDALLLVAYQCGPGLGSVSQIGWQWFTGMAQRRPVCLVTHVRNRAAIEAAPDKPADARVIYIDTEWFAGPLYRLSKRLFPRSEHGVFLLSQLDWFVFDAVALRTLRRERAAGAPWRLLHLVTPVSVSATTRLHRLGLPVVRGPLNSGLPVPPGFKTLMQDDAMGLSRLRVLPRLAEALFGSLRRSAAVLVATAATRAALPRAVQGRCTSMLENAVDPQRFAPPPVARMRQASDPLRLSFVGRLVPVKALPLLLQAIARLRAEGRSLQLDVAGDGPMAGPWRDEARALGLADQVQWHGALGLDAVAALMGRSDVLCLPSVRESGGAVLLEAMACGRPVIGMGFGGPAEIVDSAVGWLVAMPDAESAVNGLAQALREAHDDPVGTAERGRCAHQRVLDHHTWQARLDAAERLYAAAINPRSGAARPWHIARRSADRPR